jgi:2-C-methyl-D-erythritol 4-phosphate cytidylyltransferase
LKIQHWYLILAAGGTGSRIPSDKPKQLLYIKNHPIIYLSVFAITRYVPVRKIIISCYPDIIDETKKIFQNFSQDVKIIPGGETRFHSIQNALAYLPDSADTGVLIHDAARPFPSESTIKNVMHSVEQHGAGVPVIPLKESIRKFSDEGTSYAVPREKFCIVQTPQGFPASVLKKSYQTPYQKNFTDDASVVEHAGFPVTVTPGNSENIKITEPFDLQIAQLYYDSFYQ